MMKKTIITISLSFICILSYSQNTNINEQDTIKQILTKLFELRKDYDNLNDRQIFIQQLAEELSSNLTNGVTTTFPEYIEYKLEKLIESLTELQQFLQESVSAQLNIETQLKTTQYLTTLANLNNVSNDDLGASVDDILKKLIDTNITTNLKLEEKNKVNSFVNSIINNPITEAVSNSIPILNSAIQFITNISFGQKKIEQEDFQKFIAEITKYTKHYDNIFKTNTILEEGTKNLLERNDQLGKLLSSFIIERYNSLQIGWGDNLETVELKNLVQGDYYSENTIEEFQTIIKDRINSLDTVEDGDEDILLYFEENKLTLFTLLESVYPDYTTNQCLIVRDEIISIVGDYASLLENHYQELTKVLNQSANTLSLFDPDKIKSKLTELEQLKSNVILAFRNSSGIDRVKQQYKDISN